MEAAVAAAAAQAKRPPTMVTNQVKEIKAYEEGDVEGDYPGNRKHLDRSFDCNGNDVVHGARSVLKN